MAGQSQSESDDYCEPEPDDEPGPEDEHSEGTPSRDLLRSPATSRETLLEWEPAPQPESGERSALRQPLRLDRSRAFQSDIVAEAGLAARQPELDDYCEAKPDDEPGPEHEDAGGNPPHPATARERPRKHESQRH